MSDDKQLNGGAPESPKTAGDSETILGFADRLRAGADEQDDVQETFESWVVFRVSTRTLGLPVAHVREILRLPELTGVPNAPRPVAGVMNLRGHVLPVVDTHALLGLPHSMATESSRVLVFLVDDREVGLIVDEARDLARLQVELVQSVPDSESLAPIAHGLFPGAGGDPEILLLEPGKLFSREELAPEQVGDTDV